MFGHRLQASFTISPDSFHMQGEGLFMSGTERNAFGSAMQCPVLTAIEQDKIVRSVIGLIAIKVMNLFRRFKRAPKFLFQCVAMCQHIAPILVGFWMIRHPKQYIAKGIGVMPKPTFHAPLAMAGNICATPKGVWNTLGFFATAALTKGRLLRMLIDTCLSDSQCQPTPMLRGC